MEFRILGPIEVLDDLGERMPLGGPKQRALLAIFLLREGQLVSVDRLMDDLWGDELPDTARNTIQVYVSQLRKILRAAGTGQDALVTQGLGYRLEAVGESLDLNRFLRLADEGRESFVDGHAEVAVVQLRDALSLWQGEPLADFAYEPFAQSEIVRLAELRLSTLETRLEAELETGRHDGLVAELESLVREHPRRERLTVHLMLALYRGGRQEEALAVYRAAADRANEELGLDPGPELQRLQEAILRQETWLQPPVPTKEPVRGREAVGKESGFPRLSEGEMTSLVVAGVVIDEPDALEKVLSGDQVDAVLKELAARLRGPFAKGGGQIFEVDPARFVVAFGLPLASEDDPQRAGRSALSAARAGAEYAHEIKLWWGVRAPGARIALSAGRATASKEMAGEDDDSTLHRTALAMAEQAEPGTVVLDRSAAERLYSGFVVDPSVKRDDRFLLRAIDRVVVPSGPFVGRREELEQIRSALEDVRGGRGRIVVIEGEGGIGKSRILAEIRGEARDVTWLESQGASPEVGRPFHQFVGMLESWLGVTADMAPVAVRRRLLAGLKTLGPAARSGGEVLARLLGGPAEPPSSPSADVVGAATNWFADLADVGPLVALFEDVHTADASTSELVRALFGVADHAPLLLILTMRPDVGVAVDLKASALLEYPHRVEHVRIQPLPTRDSTELADALSPTGALEVSTRSEVVARAGGNPLYLGELIRILVDRGALEPRGRWTLSMTTMGAMLPPALESLLVARVHALPDAARQCAQAAAAIGREFDVRLLQEALGRDVREDLATLLRSELVAEVRRSPERACRFSHPMIQDAALATLTPAKARELYGAVAASAERLYQDESDEWSEQLGFYFYRSDEPARAIVYLERAAVRAEALGATGRAEQLRQHSTRASERRVPEQT